MIYRLVAVGAGLWLMFAPAVLGYADPAATNDRIFGPIGAAFSFVAIWDVLRPLRWITLPIGLWLILAPLLVGYPNTAAILSSIATGLVLAATAPLGGATRYSHGGGWKTLLPGESVAGGPSGSNG